MIAQLATLMLSQGPYAVGLAFDRKGDMYAANADDNVIDLRCRRNQRRRGILTRTLFTSHLNEAVYLAAATANLCLSR